MASLPNAAQTPQIAASRARLEPPQTPLPSADAALPMAVPAPSMDAGSAITPAAASSAAPGSDLPQTHDKPRSDTPAFLAGVRSLFDAIAHDDPARAEAFFFPVGAYKQVKDVRNPERDWRFRLLAEYNEDIHAYAKDLGKGREDASFVRLELNEPTARWVDPGEEWNKVGYYRVYNAQIVYSLRGKEKRLIIKSMISWRGEWYCVHLKAIARKKD